MKRITTLFFTLFIAFLANAQITITSNDLPGSGDTLRYSTADFDDLTANTYVINGANSIWDFSHLEATGQDIDEYKPSLQTPYAGFFFGAGRYGKLEADSIGFGQFQFEDVYRFYKNSNTVFEIEGAGIRYLGFPIPSVYSDKDELYQFPLDYNDFDSSTFSYTLSLLTFGTLQTKGYRTNTVDGWGQVTTPYGIFDALRVTTDVVSRDSISVGGLIDFAFDNHQREVKWMAKGESYPVMQVSGTVIGDQFLPAAVTYRDNYRTIAPSPFAPFASFEADTLTPSVGDTVSFTSTTGLLGSNTWTFNPETVTYVNGTDKTAINPQVIFDVVGVYDVTLSVINPFGNDDSIALNYIMVSAPQEEPVIDGFNIYPNPTTDILNIEYTLAEAAEVNISIHDVQGRLVFLLESTEQDAGNQKMILNLDNYGLTTGIYLLRIETGEKTQWFKVMKQ
jgi:PKD repeat protein